MTILSSTLLLAVLVTAAVALPEPQAENLGPPPGAFIEKEGECEWWIENRRAPEIFNSFKYRTIEPVPALDFHSQIIQFKPVKLGIGTNAPSNGETSIVSRLIEHDLTGRVSPDLKFKTTSPFPVEQFECNEGDCGLLWQQQMYKVTFKRKCGSGTSGGGPSSLTVSYDFPALSETNGPKGRYFICHSPPTEDQENCSDAKPVP